MAAPAYEILITIDERFVSDVAEEWLAAIARHVLEVERVGDCELGIVVTDDETVRRLNREYAGEDHSTDVLSFSLREGEEFASPEAVDCLGEVIIAYPTAARQAKEAGRSVDDETAHLLVHGTLHLLGYDHAEPEEEREMRARESALIGGRSGHVGL
jgi:probable rRNA maturation factor